MARSTKRDSRFVCESFHRQAVDNQVGKARLRWDTSLIENDLKLVAMFLRNPVVHTCRDQFYAGRDHDDDQKAKDQAVAFFNRQLGSNNATN